MEKENKKLKIALISICLNAPYWPYIGKMIESAKKHFLINNEVDFLLWSDIPKDTNYGATVFETDAVAWPYPTLMRYHLFLNQEDKLNEYDYIFYCDADMLFVDNVGEEILGDGLMMAQHPMYAFDRKFIPPYEPNPNSTAFIPRLGRIQQTEDKIWFEPLYAAGGFQGGKTEVFLKAMRSMKRSIDEDFSQNYTAIWNDESHWNKYLFDHPEIPLTVLDPGYVYPDSLINEYYIKIWGKNYHPRLVTLTKGFTTSKEAGDEIRKQLTNF